MRAPALAALFCAALSACAAPAIGPSRATGPDCVALFRAYDVTAATMSTPGGWSDWMSIPPALQWPIARLRNAGCLTMSDDLAPLSTIGPAPVVESGPAIPPTSLHAGVVTSMADEVTVLAFFDEHGVRARSIGAAGLGRRIYLGPFRTQGGLDSARDLAVRAGFASPYPARF